MGNSALSSVFKSDMSKNFSGPSPFCIKPDHPPDICVEHFKYPATFLAFTASMPSALVTSNAASMTISFVTLTFLGVRAFLSSRSSIRPPEPPLQSAHFLHFPLYPGSRHSRHRAHWDHGAFASCLPCRPDPCGGKPSPNHHTSRYGP